MIYEIMVRGNHAQQIASDNLIWIESNLPTRSFEKWLLDRHFLFRSGESAVVRWSIIQTQRPAHFVLSTQAAALEKHIADLMNPPAQIKKTVRAAPLMPDLVPDFGLTAFSLAA